MNTIKTIIIILLFASGTFGFTQQDIETATHLGRDSKDILQQLLDCSGEECNERGYSKKLMESKEEINISYEYDSEGTPETIKFDSKSNFFRQYSMKIRPDLNIDSITINYLGFIPGGTTKSYEYTFWENEALKQNKLTYEDGYEIFEYTQTGILTKLTQEAQYEQPEKHSIKTIEYYDETSGEFLKSEYFKLSPSGEILEDVDNKEENILKDKEEEKEEEKEEIKEAIPNKKEE